MAYPNFYQQSQFYQQPQNPPQMQMQAQPQLQPQMQNGGFISVPSEQVARNYPVAPGSVMTFKIENQPYVCEKAQGFSQLEGPIFNKYRLVKEESNIPQPQEEIVNYVTKDEITALKGEIEGLKKEIADLKEGV